MNTPTYMNGTKFLADLAASFGITRPVKAMTIRADVEGLVRVEVEYVAESGYAEPLKQAFALCKAVPLAEAE